MTTLQPGTQTEGLPIDDYDVVPKVYVDDADAALAADIVSSVADHEGEEAVDGGTGPVVTVRVGVRSAFISWTGLEVVVSGHGYYEVEYDITNLFTAPLESVRTKSTWMTFDGLATGVTYYFRVRAVDASGNTSGWTVSPPTAVPEEVDTGDIADGAITTPKILDGAVLASKIADGTLTYTEFASGIEPVRLHTGPSLPTLPDAEYPEGAVIFWTNDGKLYRNVADSWTATTAATDITGQITGLQITDGAIDTVKLAEDAVTAAKIATDAVTADGLAANSVTTDALVDAAITAVKLGNDSVTSAAIAAAAVTAGELADAAVTSVKIGADAVTAAAIADGAVGTAALADGSVEYGKLASGLEPVRPVGALPTLPDATYPVGAVVFLTTDGKLYRNVSGTWSAEVATTDLSGEIDGSTITAGTVDTLQLAADAVTTAKIAVDAITATEIADGAVGTLALAADAVTAAKLAVDSVTSDAIVDGAVQYDAFASGLEPVRNVGTLPVLPSASYPVGAVVFLTTDGKIYRNVSGSWTAAVATTDLSGQITETQITDDAVTTAKIAANAVTATEIAANTITAAQIAADTITAGQIAAGAIATSELAADAVTAAKIAAGTITAAEIAAGAITSAEIAAGTIVAADIAAGTITTAEIAALTIAAGNIAADAITTAKIAAGAVTATEIAALTITAGELAAGSITTAKIATGAVTANEIAANTITAGQIAAAAVNTSELAADAVTATELAANAVYAGSIQADAVGAAAIAAGAVTADAIAAGAVVAGKIAADAVTATEIAAGTITASEIAAGTITATQITAGTITTTEIALNTITASNIAAGTITASELAADTITAGQIAAGAINTSELATDAVTADKILAGTITAASGIIADLAVDTLTSGNLDAAVSLGTGGISALGAAGEVLLDSSGLRMWANTTRTGTPSVNLQASDGSATFTGEIVATSGELQSLDVTGYLTLDGGGFRTAATGNRIELEQDVSGDSVTFYTGAVGESFPGHVRSYQDLDSYILSLISPTGSTGFTPELDVAEILLYQNSSGGGAGTTSITLNAHEVLIYSGTQTHDLYPQASGIYDLGSSSKRYGDLWLGGNIDALGNITADDILPQADNTYDLGSSAARYLIAYIGGYVDIEGFASSSDQVMLFGGSWDLYVDNTGSGGSVGRWWLNCDNGGEVVLGPRAGGSTLNRLRVRGAAQFEGNVQPYSDNAYSCGTSTRRYVDVWAVDGSINTSDIETKERVTESDLGLDFLLEVGSKRWFRKGGQRPHYGPVAQDVQAAIERRGIDFAGFVDPSYDPDPTWVDENGDDLPNEGHLGLRMHEFIGPIITALGELRAEIDQLKAAA